MSGVSRCCLACDYQIKTYQAPEDECQEVTVCPKCNGAFVDVFKIEKYKRSNETVKPLLTITLTDIDAKPIVHYKGKQIDRKLRVAFDWETQSIDKINRTYIHVEHVPSDNKRFNTEVIQHNHPIVEDVNTSNVGIDGAEIVKLVCQDCGTSITGKRVSLEGKNCIHNITHKTMLIPLSKE